MCAAAGTEVVWDTAESSPVPWAQPAPLAARQFPAATLSARRGLDPHFLAGFSAASGAAGGKGRALGRPHRGL